MKLFEIDRRRLHDELTDTFITYQYRLDRPMPAPDETRETMIAKYNIDHIFRTKVQSLTAGVMFILDKHIDRTESNAVDILQKNGIDRLQS